MKQLLLFILCANGFTGKAQDSLLYQIFPLSNTKVIYEKIIETPGQNKDTLFLKAKVWALSTFKSEKSAFQTEDRNGGLLAYRTFFTNDFVAPSMMGFTNHLNWDYWSQIRIYIKDNKAKIVIENENVTITSSATTMTYDLYTFKDYINDGYKKNKKYGDRYWEASLVNFKEADRKYKALIRSFEVGMNSRRKSEADF